MVESNVEPTAELVDYVEAMLNEGTRFKEIAWSLSIFDPRQLKRMMTKALGYKFRVHHSFTTQEISNTIQGALPITEHGANWGIQHVKATLARLRIRPPRRTMARALQTISGNFTNSNLFCWVRFLICFGNKSLICLLFSHVQRHITIDVDEHYPLFAVNIMFLYPWPFGI